MIRKKRKRYRYILLNTKMNKEYYTLKGCIALEEKYLVAIPPFLMLFFTEMFDSVPACIQRNVSSPESGQDTGLCSPVFC